MLIRKIFYFCTLICVVNGQTNCHTTAWWALLPFPRDILQQFLIESKQDLQFDVSNPLMKFISPNQHPVYFEFNQQNQCQQSSLPPWLANATEQTFVEFKLEIPYLIRKNKTILLKPMIYQNNELDVSASHLVYGLPAHFATMQADFDKNIYTISSKQGNLEVTFQPLTNTLLPVNSTAMVNFSSFIDANQSPWLAFPPVDLFKRVKCASNIYDFTSAGRVRPVSMSMKILGKLLDPIPAGIYENLGDEPLGAWQVDLRTTITSTFECP